MADMPAENKKRSAQEKLGTMPIGKLLVTMSVPMMISMFIQALYNAVDSMFVARLSEDALTAVSLALPIQNLMIALAVGTGVGVNALVSRSLGEGNRRRAEKAANVQVFIDLIYAILCVGVGLLFSRRFFQSQTDVESIIDYGAQYVSIITIFSLGMFQAQGLEKLLIATGNATPSMISQALGAILNIILDPIFIFAFGMGVAGAAWATNIAMACSCAWALWYYRPGHSAVRLRWRRIGFYRAYLAKACGIGLSPALQQLAGSLVNVSLQLAFAYWAVDEASATAQIASLGIFQMVTMSFVMPLMGVQQGVAPVMGYNWGARNFRRVREALFLGLKTSTAVVSLAAALQVFASVPVVRLFTDGKDAAFVSLAAGDLRVSNCMLWCIGLNVVTTTYFQAIGRPRTAILLSLLRQVICLIPCIWLLPYLARATGLCAPATAIWLAMPISDVLACLATVPPFLSHARFLARAGRRQLQNAQIVVN